MRTYTDHNDFKCRKLAIYCAYIEVPTTYDIYIVGPVVYLREGEGLNGWPFFIIILCKCIF